MKINIENLELSKVDGIIELVLEDKTSKCNKTEKLKSKGIFKGEAGEIYHITKEENDDIKHIILLGLGKEENLNGEILRNSVAKAAKKVKELKLKSIAVQFFETNKICVGGRVKGIAEGINLSLYEFNKYKTDKKEYDLEVYINGVPEAKTDKANIRLDEVNNIIDGTILARDLVNEPSNVLYPESFASRVIGIGKASGFEVEIFDEKECDDIGMKAFLAVGLGSSRKPRLIVMRYMGDPDNNEILGLVGKGLTYDTGGYSLKPSDSMATMHSDMGGAAAVVGTMKAIASNKIKKNVVAVVAACENAISGHSYKPGDIIASMANKTIEVLNTDAEGRLTLADAVTYIIEKENVDKVIDVATLTGAALVALGVTTTAVVSNNDDFYQELEKAAEVSGEKFWRLPAFDEYKKLIKGSVADLKNLGGRNAGTITAGLFIGEFVQDKPWIHLDIAGTGWADSPTSEYLAKGGTGVPVRTLYYLIKGPCGCHK